MTKPLKLPWTAGEQLIQQGFVRREEQGFVRGEEQGFVRGERQGQRRLLLRMLRKRFGSQVDAAVEAKLAAASVEQLEAWGERLLSAVTLADVFVD